VIHVASCEMCGADETLYKTTIEGSDLKVCRKCSGFGKVISVVREPVKVKPKKVAALVSSVQTQDPTEHIQVIVEDYAERIKAAREKLGLKQEELAKAIAEKESLIHKLESGLFEPPITLARKLENRLRIHLVDQHEEKHEKASKSGSASLTIGDVLTMK
jgi:putative transcription factor